MTNFYKDTKNFIIKQQQIRINYIEEISIKSDAKKIKYYQISKNDCKLSANSLAMITQFLKMSQRNYDVIMSKYVTRKLNKSHW